MNLSPDHYAKINGLSEKIEWFCKDCERKLGTMVHNEGEIDDISD